MIIWLWILDYIDVYMNDNYHTKPHHCNNASYIVWEIDFLLLIGDGGIKYVHFHSDHLFDNVFRLLVETNASCHLSIS